MIGAQQNLDVEIESGNREQPKIFYHISYEFLQFPSSTDLVQPAVFLHICLYSVSFY